MWSSFSGKHWHASTNVQECEIDETFCSPAESTPVHWRWRMLLRGLAYKLCVRSCKILHHSESPLALSEMTTSRATECRGSFVRQSKSFAFPFLLSIRASAKVGSVVCGEDFQGKHFCFRMSKGRQTFVFQLPTLRLASASLKPLLKVNSQNARLGMHAFVQCRGS